MTKGEHDAFVRGYVVAVGEFARWNCQVTPERVLRAAGITRQVAERAGVERMDLERIDDAEGGWPVKETRPT